MTLWFVFALMTAAAIFAVLWPLGQGARPGQGGSETAVYKDQLAEIDRDVAVGRIGPPEAEAARVEIGRRLLAAAEDVPAPPAASTPLRRMTAVAALIGLPVLAAALYLPLGSPRLGASPQAAQERAPGALPPLDELVVQVQQHLEQSPADGRGWAVLAPVLARLGRYDEAVRAYRNSIIYNGENAPRRADLGEAIAAAAGGVVTSDARTEFERAVALDADDVKANYFLGLSAEQDGRTAEAASIWRGMLAKAPADAPWREPVQAALTRVGGPTAPALSDDAVAAARNMDEAGRGAMISGMVERLADRLKQNGDDVEGWLRLVRSYLVLGDRDKARSAQTEARRAVANDAERLRQLNDGLKNLGLDG